MENFCVETRYIIFRMLLGLQCNNNVDFRLKECEFVYLFELVCVYRSIRPDSILPATLELPEAGEEGFLGAVIFNVSPTTLQFKLAPTYALYLAARYRATTHFRPEVTPHERAHLLSTFLLRVSHILMQVVQERNSDGNTLAFWMANSSELLHFLKSDRQIGAFSLDAQDVLAEVVQLAFRHLVTCIQGELSNLIPHFLLERDDEDENATAPVREIFGNYLMELIVEECHTWHLKLEF